MPRSCISLRRRDVDYGESARERKRSSRRARTARHWLGYRPAGAIRRAEPPAPSVPFSVSWQSGWSSRRPRRADLRCPTGLPIREPRSRFREHRASQQMTYRRHESLPRPARAATPVPESGSRGQAVMSDLPGSLDVCTPRYRPSAAQLENCKNLSTRSRECLKTTDFK